MGHNTENTEKPKTTVKMFSFFVIFIRWPRWTFIEPRIFRCFIWFIFLQLWFVPNMYEWTKNSQNFYLKTLFKIANRSWYESAIVESDNIISLAKIWQHSKLYSAQNKHKNAEKLQSGAWSRVWEIRQRSWFIAGRLCSLWPYYKGFPCGF